MASYKRFEDTPAWRLSLDYAYAIFEVTQEACFKFRGDLVNQLRRAALSISNNIAAGGWRSCSRTAMRWALSSGDGSTRCRIPRSTGCAA